MSIVLSNRVRALPLGTFGRRELHFLLTLADIARDDGIGFSGVSRIAQRAMRTERVTKLALAMLRKRGILINEREGGGRRKDGTPRRTIWRIVLPNLAQLPRPANLPPLNNLRTFPQTFQQDFHNGDQTITVNSDQTITVNGDQTCTQEVPQTSLPAATCPVENAPIRPVRTRPGKIHVQEEALPLLEDAEQTMRTDRARLDALEHARGLMARIGTIPEPRRRRRSTGGS